jgi:hypothetical protein
VLSVSIKERRRSFTTMINIDPLTRRVLWDDPAEGGEGRSAGAQDQDQDQDQGAAGTSPEEPGGDVSDPGEPDEGEPGAEA